MTHREGRVRLSRVRVVFQVFLHIVLAAHVAAWYWLDWRAIGGLDFQDFFHNLLGEGILTAAVLFAGLIYISSLIWGRLFCSWGCHFGAAQDLAAWVLRRLGWRTPYVKTRFLHWLPFAVLAAVFLWPLARGWLETGWTWRGAAHGSILAGDGPWERLPGWFLSILTFLICGAVALLFLGTRGFCRFVCPYGAVFRMADFVAPFRVRRTGSCSVGCGEDSVAPCTLVCPTAIDVHEEVHRENSVTSTDCVRCHLCIEACPSQALSHTWRGLRELPVLATSSVEATPSRVRYTLTLVEELVAVLVAIGTYAAIDLVWGGHFLAATLALAESFLVLIAMRLLGLRDASALGLPRLRPALRSLVLVCTLGTLLLSAVPIYTAASFKVHRALGFRAIVARPLGDERERQAMELATQDEESLRRAAIHLQSALTQRPGDRDTRRALCLVYDGLGDTRAIEQAEALVEAEDGSAASIEMLRRLYIKYQRFREAEWLERRQNR